MRIVIAGPPKAGNVWLKCLLANVYGLRWLKEEETPQEPTAAAFLAWVRAGGFPNGTIFHKHYACSAALCDLFDAIPAHLVTIVRDPYDAFVATYFRLQDRTDEPPPAPGERDSRARIRPALAGKPLDHPDVLAFLADGGYGLNLVRANQWVESGRSLVVRYEALKADTAGELRRLTDRIAPASPDLIDAAVEACSVERMRQMNRQLARHVRKGEVGDSQNHLTEAHLAIFRETYGDLIRRLGYEVR